MVYFNELRIKMFLKQCKYYNKIFCYYTIVTIPLYKFDFKWNIIVYVKWYLWIIKTHTQKYVFFYNDWHYINISCWHGCKREGVIDMRVDRRPHPSSPPKKNNKKLTSNWKITIPLNIHPLSTTSIELGLQQWEASVLSISLHPIRHLICVDKSEWWHKEVSISHGHSLIWIKMFKDQIIPLS